MRKDNEAFATECEENTAQSQDAQMTDSSDKNNSTSVQYASSQEQERDQNVNVFDYEVSDFDSERGSGREMQEKPRTSLLGNGNNQATNQNSNQAKISQALDDDTEWNPVNEDEEMADHVETAKP